VTALVNRRISDCKPLKNSSQINKSLKSKHHKIEINKFLISIQKSQIDFQNDINSKEFVLERLEFEGFGAGSKTPTFLKEVIENE